MKIIIFDTETTGFPSPSLSLDEQPHVVQFGALQLECDLSTRRLTKLQEIDQLIRPSIKIPAESSEIHGITDERVKDAPTFAEYEPTLTELFRTSDVAVAHNLEFDRKIIEIQLERLGQGKNFLPPQTFDTMTASTDICRLPGRHGGFKSPRLEEAYQHFFGQNFEGAHSALADVYATARVMKELLKRGIFDPKEPEQKTLF